MFSALLVVALLCLSTAALAQDTPPLNGDAAQPKKGEYQPTLTYGEHNDEMDERRSKVGIVESDPEMKALRESERAYFVARDHDGDGYLSKEEFVRQLNNVNEKWDDQHAEGANGTEWDSFDIKERGRELPSKQAMLYGKDWSSRLGKKETDEAFAQFDSNKDNLVSWEEWASLMFHGEPQIPEFRDGEIVKDDSGVDDDQVSDDEIKEIKRRFRKFDLDKDDHLTVSEVLALIKHSHDEPDYPDGVVSYERPSDDEMAKYAGEIVAAQDGDKDGKITMEEWVAGGGY